MKILNIEVVKYCAETSGYTLLATLNLSPSFEMLEQFCIANNYKYMTINSNSLLVRKEKEIIHFYSDNTCLLGNINEIEKGKEILSNLIKEIHCQAS